MAYISFPRGLISIYSHPIGIVDDAFKIHSKDLEVSMYIDPPHGLDEYFHEAYMSWDKEGIEVYTPCVVKTCVIDAFTHVPKSELDNEAQLLLPPDTTEESDLFVSELVIPNLRICETIENKYQSTVLGYLLKSQLTPQKFFISPKKICSGTEDIEYQGIIASVNRDVKRHPSLYITTDSRQDPRTFDGNREKLNELMELKNSETRFWWNLK